ncbi:antirepressor [Chryseobacterium sp. FH2]|uniref:M56 family metallopeptidase n=1 Tax=Chryseobacterium sp. FH2 TaxID=1674291 RepID=UPI00065AF08D|nr:M56 family metallopeptidase [Chryseobacterium sp. FH2]KMQ69008.1 antirepressor [Chryseobacterium sp. FH2]
MEAILLYFGKVILCSGVMFLYYQLSLKDKTFHHYNRFYLLSAMLISLLLPLIKVEDFTIEVSNDLYKLIDQVQNFNTTKNINNDHIYLRIIFSGLGLVSFYFLGRFIYGIFRIQQIKNQFQKESFDGINFYHTNLTEAPFSYFKNLFWKNSITLNSDIGKQILKHEMVHIEQKHSFDKIFIEIITSVFWFNPFFHIIKKEISLIHEYLADKKAVKQSDTKAFAQMLLASHFSGTQLPATSPFLSSNLKKRLKMLQKPKTKFGYARRIFALPIVFSVAFAYLVNAKNKEIKATNIEIEKAVSQIKKDTIAPGKAQKTEVIAPKLAKKEETQQKLNDLSKKIEEKSTALKELKPESKEFKKNVDELGALSAEIGKIASSDDFRMAYKMDNADVKKINEYFKSDEWKSKVAELKNMNIEIPDMPEMNFDFPDAPLPPSAPNAPDAPKVKVYSFKDMKWSPETDMVFKSSEKSKESAATAKKRAKLEKERAKLDEKRAKLEGERAKLEAERRALDGDRRMYIYSNTFNAKPMKFENVRVRTMKNNADIVVGTGLKKYSGDTNNMKFYIDGKQVSKQELDAINPNDIANMNVIKRSKDGDPSGEIRIETKKK